MGNFDFIKAEWPVIYDDCARAESYLTNDPRSACFYARRSIEVLVNHLYDLLALLSQVTTASMWMRLPTLIAGVLTWWILSREILPRLGQSRRASFWTAAFVFLAFWLPYNNGIRPEPIVALGVMVTWASFERAISTHRLLP
ncbi:arabinosyltransferase domain-containing protein, partial [Dermacoccus nishinomiyaensis]|uniref:arabinosyltransferase domain-containing protein n=1 Tax=Dermacoccus nishinomiyaensis TaxID=1274 RepID=UPI00248F2BFE